MDIKPPFRRQGNKYPIRKELLSLIPYTKIYVEPFVGSGAIFFSKEKSQINILNDLDNDVVERLKLLQKAPLNPNEYINDLNTIPKLTYFYNNHSNSIPDKILYQKIKASNGFSGNPITTKLYINQNPFLITKHLSFYKQMLKDVKILHKDYTYIIKKFDGPETFFFLDPPYENTHKLFYSNTEFNYNKFKLLLDKIQGYFLLTINDSDFIRNLFKKKGNR